MTSEDLSILAGVGLSLAFSYLPGVQTRFNRLSPTRKRLVMLGLLAGLALGIFGLSCLGQGPAGLPCSQAGAWVLLRIFLSAVIANQAAFEISPRQAANGIN